MQFKLIIETDLSGITPDEIKDVISYNVGFSDVMLLDSNNLYNLMSSQNTRIISCVENEPVKTACIESVCEYEDYFQGH